MVYEVWPKSNFVKDSSRVYCESRMRMSADSKNARFSSRCWNSRSVTSESVAKITLLPFSVILYANEPPGWFMRFQRTSAPPMRMQSPRR